ncbi:nucleotidyltransferase domain-containing protein, partial [Pseudomonas aeruginosa]|uniref:nucleotidyltransferase domain-containing protein n=1 Tax=Pseudomonas aeruginosa TaxID=287 RepID=UPI0020A173B4
PPPPPPHFPPNLNPGRRHCRPRHPEVSKIDFDIGHLDQARDPANRDSWGYWLKHRCRCLWGEDLASDLPPLRPAKAIALALNGDYAQVLEDYARRLESASSEEERRRLQREAAKKLIRSSDILRGETESVWPETLEHYLALFRARHPGQAPALEYFKAVLDDQVTDPAVFIERLRAFSAWMQRQA